LIAATVVRYKLPNFASLSIKYRCLLCL